MEKVILLSKENDIYLNYEKEVSFLCSIKNHKYHFNYMLYCYNNKGKWIYYSGETKNISQRLQQHKKSSNWIFVQLVYFKVNLMPFNYYDLEEKIKNMSIEEKEELIKTTNVEFIDKINKSIGLPLMGKEFFIEKEKRKKEYKIEEINKEKIKQNQELKENKIKEKYEKKMKKIISNFSILTKTQMYFNYLIDSNNITTYKNSLQSSNSEFYNKNKEIIESTLLRGTNDIFLKNIFLNYMIEHLIINPENSYLISTVVQLISNNSDSKNYSFISSALFKKKFSNNKFERNDINIDIFKYIVKKDKKYLLKNFIFLLNYIDKFIEKTIKIYEENEGNIRKIASLNNDIDHIVKEIHFDKIKEERKEEMLKKIKEERKEENFKKLENIIGKKKKIIVDNIVEKITLDTLDLIINLLL